MSVFTTNLLLEECGVPPRQYIDMIRAFDAHASFTQGDIVLIVATVATIRSGVYQDVLSRKGVTSFEYAFTDLAGAIERNAPQNELIKMIEEGILYAYQLDVTHIVYGCTHFPLVHHSFLLAQKNLNWKGEFIDPAVYIAEEIKKWALIGERRFTPYSSKDTPAFINNVIKFI
jgi:glutamate racemase